MFRPSATNIILIALGAAAGLSAEVAPPKFSIVYKSGGKYESIRTPVLYITKAGTWLAFAQGRVTVHDQSDIDILLKRSTDGGRTWSDYQKIADSGKDALNSYCVVQDRASGRILLLGGIVPAGYEAREYRYLSPAMQEYQRQHGREKEPAIQPGFEGPAISRNYVISSDDDGNTWSPLKDVTRSVKRPAPALWAMPGPGLGIQLERGAHAGRIVIPTYVRRLDLSGPKPMYEDMVYAIYSDDAGKSWKYGDIAKAPAGFKGGYTAEPQMVELEDGSILMNGRALTRNTAVSRDGGATWSELKVDEHLVTFACAGGLIRYSGSRDGGKSRLVFANPVTRGRLEGRIWLSYDEGRTWPVYKVLTPERFAYNTLAKLPDGRIAALYDGKNAEITLAIFTLEWLTDGKDHAATGIAPPQFVNIYEHEQYGKKYESIRTPVIYITKAGTWLAFAQGRGTIHDQSDIDLVLKRSTDSGRTWSDYKVIADSGKDALNSYSVVQERQTGRIFLMGAIFPAGYEKWEFRYMSQAHRDYQTKANRVNNPAVHPGFSGAGVSTAYLISSDDDGKTWSPLKDITRSVKRSDPAGIWVMPGPGIGIQLERGPHAGRIVIPGNVMWQANKYDPPKVTWDNFPTRPYAIYSDDRGKTWQYGDLARNSNSVGEVSETQMVELIDGSVMLNSRGDAVRDTAVSADGGKTWSPLAHDRQLIATTPTAGGLIRYSGGKDGKKSRLIFCHPVKDKRVEGRIWMSYDEGKTWPVSKTLTPDRFAYSTLARLPDGRIGCLFDGERRAVVLATFTLAWLTDGKDTEP